MKISIIVAVDEDFGIGLEGKLPWSLPSDLKRFKQITLGHTVLMGRKPYESIGRPLPGRSMLVISQQEGYFAAGCQTVSSLEEGIQEAHQNGETELFVIGGGQVYQQVFPLSDRLYLTRVQTRAKTDTFFPAIDFSQWELVEQISQDRDEKHLSSYIFGIYDRKG